MVACASGDTSRRSRGLAAHVHKAAYLLRQQGVRGFVARVGQVVARRVVSAGKGCMCKLTDRMPPRVFRHDPDEFAGQGVVPAELAASDDGLPTVGVVIVSYNSAQLIEATVAAVLVSDYPQDRVEIVLVDNNSPDGSLRQLEYLEKKYPRVRVLANERNLGFGAAVNVGAEHCSAEYVLCVNPDAHVRPDTIRQLVCRSRDTHERGFRLWEARQLPFEHPKLYDAVTLETQWASGACFLVDRAVFLEQGGFDENIFLYCEDVDLSWRLRAAGYRIGYVPWAVVDHDTYAEPGRMKATQFYNSVVSNGILRFKFGSLRDMLVYAPLWCWYFVVPPKLKLARLKLLGATLKAIPRYVRALSWRTDHRDLRKCDVAQFTRFGFEINRQGDYFRTRSHVNGPLVSIIVRTMNRPHFLREALASIQNQTYQNIEVVVVEDGLAKSQEVIGQFPQLNIIYFATEERAGRCKAGNMAMARATGEYLNFLDEDDLFYSDHLEVLVGELSRQTECAVAYSMGLEVATVIQDTAPFVYTESRHETVHRQKFDRELLQSRNYIPIHCVLFARWLFEEEGGFNESLDVLEDWNLWVRYARRSDFLLVPKTTTLYRVPADRRVAATRSAQFALAYQNVVEVNQSAAVKVARVYRNSA